MKRIAFALAVVGLMAASAAAKDMWDPWWDMTGPGTTYQVWDFTMEPDGPFIVENPYGPPDPHIEWPELVNYEMVPGPDGTLVGAWHIDGPPGVPPKRDVESRSALRLDGEVRQLLHHVDKGP